MKEAVASQVVANVRDVLSHLPWLPHVQCTAPWQGLHDEDEAAHFCLLCLWACVDAGWDCCSLLMELPAHGAVWSFLAVCSHTNPTPETPSTQKIFTKGFFFPIHFLNTSILRKRVFTFKL